MYWDGKSTAKCTGTWVTLDYVLQNVLGFRSFFFMKKLFAIVETRLELKK